MFVETKRLGRRKREARCPLLDRSVALKSGVVATKNGDSEAGGIAGVGITASEERREEARGDGGEVGGDGGRGEKGKTLQLGAFDDDVDSGSSDDGEVE